MKHLKIFEDFKLNNKEETLITSDDIIKCIKNRGLVYATIIKNYPNNDPKVGMTPIDIDQDNLITVEYNNNEYLIDLNHIEKIEY
jgi:hypothetical protein